MKNITIPALAVVGALTLAATPAAQAESSVESSEGASSAASSYAGSSLPAPAAGQEEMPHLKQWEAGAEAGTYNGVAWYYHFDGIHVVARVEDIKADVATLGDASMTIQHFAEVAGYAQPATDAAPLAGSAGRLVEVAAEAGSSALALPFAAPGSSAGTLAGQEWFYNKDISFVVNSRDLVNQTITAGQAGTLFTVDFASQLQRALPINVMLDQSSSAFNVQNTADTGAQAEEQGGSSLPAIDTSLTAGSSADSRRLVLIALPAALLIGGITYYLNQDGRTYVESSARTSSTPTEQERSSSESLLSSNRPEVQRQALEGSSGSSNDAGFEVAAQSQQGDAPQVRGIGAETGSNGFARGLAGLVIASLLGAIAFHFGRKQLV